MGGQPTFCAVKKVDLVVVECVGRPSRLSSSRNAILVSLKPIRAGDFLLICLFRHGGV